MLDAGRPLGRLFYFVLVAAAIACAQAPATTTVSDTVYRADGTPASGTLLISWPAFTTAAGQAVAAGTKSVTLGAQGALSVALVPNAGATPAGTLYTVVYHLDTVKTEYWVVPTSSPATVAAVRTTPGEGGTAAPLATRQYVDSSVASKASDTAVVHKSGGESIAGVKQFSSSPSVPTPSQSTDAANKAYVDAAVGTVGAGSFVSKTGDTMSGPLTLSSDPSAPSHAATRHYVDTGLAAKADVVSGVVPSNELGAGTADSTVCLKGNATWGACGTSSDAVSIQSVPVDATAPTDNQVITYEASSGKYKPKPGGGVTAGMQALKYAPDFNWTQSPSADLSTPGSKTVSLSACPAGVKASEPQYFVYVAGTGTAEAVQVTGGTCAGNGSAGSLQFTTVNAHSSGYTVGSASGGLQEALIAGRIIPSNPTGTSQTGKIIVPPGEFKAFARVSIRATNVTVDFSGSIVECDVADTCIFVGDPSNFNAFNSITLIGPRGRPTVANGQFPFIEVNAQKTRIFNVSTRTPLSGGTFGSLVQVDYDQAFLLDGLDTRVGGAGVRCDATVCNPVIYAPGPFSTAASVGWLKNLNLELQCQGNGVDWQSGNGLRISDSIIEGYAQFGVRAGTRRGGFSGFILENVHEEEASSCNPLGNIGAAGVIAEGAGSEGVRIQGSTGAWGWIPQFANTGSTDYRYYVVARHATFGPSNPLYAGRALTNGNGNITVTTPEVAGASTFDLLRVPVAASGTLQQAPFGTGNYAVATSVSRGSACSAGVCTFTDTQAGLSSYTVASPTYFPMLDFWPGGLILGSDTDSNNISTTTWAFVDNLPLSVVSVAGTVWPAVVASRCPASTSWGPLWLECLTPQPFHFGSLLLAAKPAADGGQSLNLKGRLNLGTIGTGPGHLITLFDSNFAKTIATSNNRPGNDSGDAYIGYDKGQENGASLVGISLGAPASVSNYIGNAGDGTNWKERLTATLKEFKTDVQVDGTLKLAGTEQASGAWTMEGAFGTMTAAGSGKSKLGFGASGKLQVSENAGAVVEVAKLNSNGDVNANAISATQLATMPAQCSGSFATGIQADGDANCSTADVIQLAETTPPSGIANFGIFWFDSACHCPKVISNNGQPVQLGLTNVFNADANTLEERNGTSAQAFNVYRTYTDASNYERMRLGYDATDGYFVVASEAAGSGTQRGLGLWLQGQLRWVVDASFNFKPFADNLRDIGASTLRPKTVYAGTAFDMTGGALVTELANDGTTGTTLAKLAKLTGAGAAVIAGTGDTSGIVGIVTGGAGTSSNATVARSGQASCVFDGATTANDYVQISSTVAGDCHDGGATRPVGGQILGRVLSTNGSGGTYAVLVNEADIQGAPASAAAAQSCTNQLLSAVDGAGTSGNCKTVTSAYVDTSVAAASGTLTSGAYLVGGGTNSVGVSGHLFDNGSNAFDLRNGSNAQTAYIYKSYTDASNYERVGIGYVSGDNAFEITTQKAGSGSQWPICFGASSAGGACNWSIDTSGMLKPFSDNSKDFGTSSLRIRDLYLGRNLIMTSTVSKYNNVTTAGSGVSAVYGAASLTAQTAAISTTNLCASASCVAGQYVVEYYVDSTATCATPGPGAVSLTLGWTDETGARTVTAPVNGAGISSNAVGLGVTNSFGSGSFPLWSSGSAAITYATSYTACTSGAGTYALRVAVRQVQ